MEGCREATGGFRAFENQSTPPASYAGRPPSREEINLFPMPTNPPKLYLAGPDVFRPDAVEYAQTQRNLCEQYGFIGLHPMDNNIDLSESSMRTATKVYRGDINQIKACDLIIANCNAFRGALIDDGTAYELGYGNALGIPTYGYIDRLIPAQELLQSRYSFTTLPDGRKADSDGFLLVDDFGTSINLMMQCGMLDSGGRLVEGDVETCLRVIRQELDTRTPSLANL